MHTRRFRRPLATAVALLAITGLAAGCGSDTDKRTDGGSTTSTAPGAEAPAADIDAPDEINIAYQAIPNGDLIVKQQKLLEKALPHTKINWKIFDSGGAVNEAVASGDIDFGLAGSSPVSRGISNGLDYRVIWIHDVIGEAESLVVKEDIASIEDLAGKTIATPFASTAHYSLLAALQDAGVDPSTVDIIDSEPDDIYSAWTTGDIDGAYVWNPNLAKLIADDGKVLISSADLAEKGATTYDLGVVSNSFADEYPDVVTEWVKAQDQAVALLNDDPDTAAEIIAAELEIATEDALAQIGDLIYLRASVQAGPDHLGGGLAQNLIKAARFNVEQGEIDEAAPDETFVERVDATFAKAAGE